MLTIDVEEKDRVVIVNLSGELLFSYIEEFGAVFKKYINSKKFDVIALDLKNVPYLDSFGISRIIKISRQLIAGGAEFFLINMNDEVFQIFKIATLDRLFPIMTREDFMLTYNPSGRATVNSYTEIIEEGKFQIKQKKEVELKYVEFLDESGITTVYLD